MGGSGSDGHVELLAVRQQCARWCQSFVELSAESGTYSIFQWKTAMQEKGIIWSSLSRIKEPSVKKCT